MSESESLRNKHGDIYRSMMTAIDKAATQAGAFTDEAERAAYVSETAAMFADQVLAEANFRKVAIDEVLKASDIVFEDGGIKFKTGMQVFDDAGNVLEQAMYPSNQPDFSSFYDYAQTKPEKKSYYDLSLDDLSLRIPQDVAIHDKNDHSLTEPEWNGVFEGMKNPIEARVSLTPNSYGKISALLKINANGRLYGVSVTLAGQSNYISTAFKTTDAGYIDWVNKKKKGTSDMPAPENPAGPSSVKHGDVITGKSLNEIISNLRSEINTPFHQSAFAGSRVDYDTPSLEAINSGEGAQAFDDETLFQYYPEKVKVENGIVDLTEAFDQAPTIEEVKQFIQNAIESGSKFQTLSPDFFLDMPTRKKAIGKLENRGNYKKLDKIGKKRHRKYIMALEKIAENAVQMRPFEGKKNTKQESKATVERYYYFKSKVRIGKQVYELYFDAEKNIGESENKPQTVHLYNIKEVVNGRGFTRDSVLSTTSNENNMSQYGGGVKGSYSPYKRLIQLTEKADYSTLPHEFAHFWLSEMQNWVNSGLASEDYLKRYDIAMDWLNAEAGKPLSRRAQEQFARGYEQYLLNGNLPESPMNPLYAEYDKWLKAVYDDLNQPSKKPLTTDMVRFFQSMTTGTLPDTVLPPVNVDRREKKENGEGTPRPEVAGNDEGGENAIPRREGVSKTETTTESVGNLTPVAVEAKDGKVSAAAERQNRLNKINGLLKEDPQNVFYDPITLEDSARQAEMLMERDGADGVRQMIDGERPMPENVIRTAVMIAYEQEMLKRGNTAEYLRVLRKHTLEQTRRGQEISAERINQDITNPSYWAKQALLGRKQALSDAVFERIKQDGDTKEKAVDRFVAETAAEYAEKLEQAERSDNLKKADLINPSFDEETDRLFSIYEKGENESAKAEVGKVSDLLVELAKDKLPVDIRGYNHDIDTSAIGHIYKNHGDVEKEAKRGQIAVVKDDYKRIPEIIYNWDYIAFGSKNKRGQDVIVYGKNMPDGSSVYIEEVRTGRKTLTTNTFRKYKTGVNSNSFAARINDNVRGNTGNVQIIAKEDVKNNIHSGDVQKIIKELNNKVKSITGEQLELFQKESVAGKTYDAVYDEIGRWIEECFDVSVSAEEMNVLKEKTDELARAFAAGLKPGENPSVEAMGKIREMRETVAAMNPTNWLSLAVNSYGRAAMLSSPKSAVLNILSNAETYITEAIARRIAAGSFEKAETVFCA